MGQALVISRSTHEGRPLPSSSVSVPRATTPSTRRILLCTAAATSCGVLPAFLLGSQAVQIGDDLGLDDAAIGTIVACAWIGAAAFSSPLGRVAEAHGGGRTLRLAAFASAAVMLGIAVLGGSPVALAGLVAAGGVVNAATQPSANLLITRTVPPSRHGTAFAVKQSAIPVATLLGGLAVPALALTLGWRWSYAAGALLAVVAAAAVPVGQDDAEPPTDDPETEPEPGAVPPTRATGDPGLFPLVVLGCGVGFGAAAAGALTTFLTSAATDAGIAEGTAGLLLTAGSAVGIAARLAMGARADRVGGGQLGTVAGMLGLGALAYAGFALDTGWVYLVLTPLAFGAGWAWPGLFNLSVVRAYPSRPAAATGTTQTGTYLGAGAGPLAIGWISDGHPWSVAWLATSVLAGAAAVAVLAGRAAVRRTRRTPGALSAP